MLASSVYLVVFSCLYLQYQSTYRGRKGKEGLCQAAPEATSKEVSVAVIFYGYVMMKWLISNIIQDFVCMFL